MNEATSFALRCCIFAGIALVATGLILSGSSYGEGVMWTGLLILILSPFAGVLVTYSHLIAEKDWKWAKVATILVAIILIFLAVSLLRN
ncbi:MAG: DUF1634 domain-containing protein [Candidatus Methanoplasma sp.]|jgi:uncharacterized membrane protein|nr:DUF1634 domain-containing protein [Candidatus Methanoplasma sp.]